MSPEQDVGCICACVQNGHGCGVVPHHGGSRGFHPVHTRVPGAPGETGTRAGVGHKQVILRDQFVRETVFDAIDCGQNLVRGLSGLLRRVLENELPILRIVQNLSGSAGVGERIGIENDAHGLVGRGNHHIAL